jgi:hypothetical protein
MTSSSLIQVAIARSAEAERRRLARRRGRLVPRYGI